MTDSSIWSARSVTYNTRNLHEGRELSVITHKCENSQFIEIVHVKTLEALIQALGYLKSQSDGPVFFRGQDKVYSSIAPSPSGIRKHKGNSDACRVEIYNTIKNAGAWPKCSSINWNDDILLSHCLMMNNKTTKNLIGWDVPLYAFEPLLQHYGLETRWLDLTDSLPYALFFSLARYGESMSAGNYNSEELKGLIPDNYPSSLSLVLNNIPVALLGDTLSLEGSEEYVYLYAISPGKQDNHMLPQDKCKGLYKYTCGYVIDMRQAVPSTYVRPHAQHGLLYAQLNKPAPEFCIFEIDTRKVVRWIGNGTLFKVPSIYPPVRRIASNGETSCPIDTGFYQWERNLFKLVSDENYSFSICNRKAAWNCFKRMHNFISPDLITEELILGKRNLLTWLKNNR